MTTSDSGQHQSVTSPEALAAELAAMLRTGVTVKTCIRAPALLSLAIVAAKAASTADADRAVSASGLVREACARVDDITSGPTAILLGVAPGYRGQLWGRRRADAAAGLHVSPDHFRKERELGLVEAVADEIYAMDSAYRLRHRHRLDVERQPEKTRLGINWLEQHRSYRRIWTPVTGLRNDLLVLLDYLSAAHLEGQTPQTVAGDTRADIADRLSSMTWYLACFSTELQRFVDREGGLWLLADADAEVRAADAIYRMGVHLPFGEADVSWARRLLKDTAHGELAPFIEALINQGTERRIIMSAWIDWAWTLVTQRGTRSARSPVECARWLAAGDEFISLIDEDWYRVADWYRSNPT